MNAKLAKLLPVFLAYLILNACGGGGGGGSSSSPGTGGGTAGAPEQVAPDMTGVTATMTTDERNLALSNVSAAWAQFSTSSLDADNEALANYIRTLPEFADAGVSPDQTVWARFKDGRPVVWLSGRRADAIAPARSSAAAALAASDTGVRPLSFEIPQSGTAVLIDVGGVGRGGPAAVAPWLTTAGYSPVQLGGSLNDLMTKIRDADVLYFSTHGMFSTAENGKRVYVLFSAEPFSIATPAQPTSEDLLRESMHESGLLVQTVNQPQPGVPSYEYHWAITEEFVKLHWTFKKDSLIVIDACSLFDATTAARAAVGASFRSALQARSQNATTVVGWSGVVVAGFAADTVKLFFDRVLGANAIGPESPPRRPFFYDEVYLWMVKQSKDFSPGNPTAKLSLEALGTLFGQLVPFIARVDVRSDEKSSTGWMLEIAGGLGPNPGAGGVVSVNGSAVNIAAGGWTDVLIRAEYPPSGPTSTGDVVVSVRGHKSNAVPLTQWTGTVVQEREFMNPSGRLHISCTGTVEAAGDVHLMRDNLAGSLSRDSQLLLRARAPCAYTFSGSWTSSGLSFELSGSGQMSPIAQDRGVGDLSSADSSPALPARWEKHFGQLQDTTLAGQLKLTHLDGSKSTSGVTAEWLSTGGSITLKTDFSFSGLFDCGSSGGPQCAETWNLVPVNTPSPDTKS